MKAFNERIEAKASQGWSPCGAFVPAGWSNRSFPGVMTGLWFEMPVPGIARMTVGGVSGKGILFSWGERGSYQLFFAESEEGRLYKTVYSRAGRFELSMTGELGSIQTIRCGEAALHGSTKQLGLLPELRVLELQGTGVRARIDDFDGLALRELSVCGSEVLGGLDGLAGQTELEVLRLAKAQGVTGNIGVIAAMPKLRRLDLYGCSGLDYTHRVLPSGWVAPEFDLSDTGLSAVAVDQFLNDLAMTFVAGGRLNIAGNNAAHTVASDEALLVLDALGWELVYNGAVPVVPGFGIGSFRLTVADNPALTEEVTGLITGRRIILRVPEAVPVTALVPRMTLPDGATVSPGDGVAVDFTASLG